MALARRILFLAGLAAVLAAGGAAAEDMTAVRIGYTPGIDSVGLFIAKEHGFFANHGLDVTLVAAPLGAAMPPALISDSLDIAGPTAPVLVQAVSGGLDLVAISGGSISTHGMKNTALIARRGIDLSTPQSYAGKRIGVPGLGSFLHALMADLLEQQNVDLSKVNFIEVPIGQSIDAMKSGSIDAVMTVEPMVTALQQSGTGDLVLYPSDRFPDGLPILAYIATRDWAEKHSDTVAGFRAAMDEAEQLAASDPEEMRKMAVQYLKFPPELVKGIALPKLHTAITVDDLALWVDLLQKHGLIGGPVDANKLVLQ